jgi:anti-anti-sigma factor
VSANDGTVWYLRTQEEQRGPIVVLKLEGRVSSATSGDLAQALDRIRMDGRRALVVDLTAVDYMNGRGLTILKAAATRLQSTGQELIACGLCPPVRTAFELSGALERVHVESTCDAALRRAADLSGS